MRWLSLSIRRQPDGTQNSGARAAFTSPAGNGSGRPQGARRSTASPVGSVCAAANR